MQFQIYNIQDRNNFIEILSRIKFPIKIDVDGIYPNRSMPQNRYLHMIIGMYAEHLGMTAKHLKDDLQKRYTLVEEQIIDGKLHCIVESTAKMTSRRLEEFTEQIRREAIMEHNLYLPEPNELIDTKEELTLKLL